jgi:hypothetical protein
MHWRLPPKQDASGRLDNYFYDAPVVPIDPP